MARTANSDAEVTRGRLLGAAAELFAQRGLEGTSVRDIARNAGVNQALVSHYFGGKRGLYQAAVDAMYSELAEGREAFLTSLRTGQSPIELLEETIRSACSFAYRNRNALRLVTRHVLDRGELDPERTNLILLPFLNEVSEVLGTVSTRKEGSLRLSLQSLVFLIVRYALMSDEELPMVANTEKNPRQAVEDHLVFVALSTLGLKELEFGS